MVNVESWIIFIWLITALVFVVSWKKYRSDLQLSMFDKVILYLVGISSATTIILFVITVLPILANFKINIPPNVIWGIFAFLLASILASIVIYLKKRSYVEQIE